MYRGRWFAAVIALFVAVVCPAADVPVRPITVAPAQNGHFAYYWKSESITGTAQLLTLFCKDCGPAAGADATPATADFPLLAVLRDTLGDSDPTNDRVLDIWLLGYANPGIGKKLLSAVPFFYWSPGAGSKSGLESDPKPFFDLTAPQHPVVSGIGASVLQWTVLDAMTMPIRATSRAYRSNGLDDERLHLETAASYLRNAPVSDDGSALTKQQVDTIIARLELRKKMLGGLISERRAARVGEESGFQDERIRSRNWELLRQLAEKTGLTFEPLNIAGTEGDYALLWFPVGRVAPATGTDLKPLWKILNIRDPWSDEKLKPGSQFKYVRETGDGADRQTFVPLAVYSLTYPKVPLVLVDFRGQVHIRRHEMTQRSINELTAGVIGISHFTNWYYYVAADLYDLVSGRHGAAVDQAERLDAYSRLRISLALDRDLDPNLRKTMQARLDDVSVNPLSTAPQREIPNAETRYAKLQEETGPGGHLSVLLDRQRRAEIAEFGASSRRLAAEALLHTATLGLYHDRARRSEHNSEKLDVYRRVQHEMTFLDSLAESGTAPEVAYDTTRIEASIATLSSLMQQITQARVRAHAAATLQKIRTLSALSGIQAQCSEALASIKASPTAPGRRLPTGIVAETAAVRDK